MGPENSGYTESQSSLQRQPCQPDRERGVGGWGAALSKQQRRPSVDPTVSNSHCTPGTSKSVFQIPVLWNLDV